MAATIPSRLVKAIEDNAQGRLLLDMEEIAPNGVMVNAIMQGLVAGCGRLPINAETFTAAIRADGKVSDANLKGFRLGLAVAREHLPAIVRHTAKRARAPVGIPAALEAEIVANVPAAARDIAVEGVRRLAAYQDVAYARHYAIGSPVRRQALRRDRAASRGASFEDVIGLAEEKINPERFARLRSEMKIGDDTPLTIVRISQALHRGTVLTAATALGAANSARPHRQILLGHGGQAQVGHRLSALCLPRQAQALPAAKPALPGSAGRYRRVACAHRRGGQAVR
jgi:hypothetical protein